MRRSFKRIRLLIVSAMMFTSCISREQEYPSASPDASFSLDEAKTVFERSLVVTRGGGRKGPFGEMAFTPEWKRASFGRGRRSIEFYRIPILTKNVYSVIRGEYQEGLSQIKADRLQHRLIVVKDADRGVSCCYLETEIPAGQASLKGGYSGLRLYTEIAGGCIVGVYKYRRGVRIDGVFLPGEPMTRTLREAHARALLSGIRMVSGLQIETRSEEWGYEDQTYYDMGGGFYYDDDGYVYCDTDGDGIPDTLWIDPLEFDGNDDPGWGGYENPWNDPEGGYDEGYEGDEGEGGGDEPNPEGYGTGGEPGEGPGGNSGGQENGFQPHPADVMAMNIPDALMTIDRQLPGGCTLAAIEYACQLYGKNIDEGNLTLNCWKIFGFLPYTLGDNEGGLPLEKFEELIDLYFYRTNLSLLTDVIDGGDLAFAIFRTNDGGHVVVVVGYNIETDQLIVMDSEIGVLSRKGIDSNLLRIVGVGGVK